MVDMCDIVLAMAGYSVAAKELLSLYTYVSLIGIEFLFTMANAMFTELFHLVCLEISKLKL
jgi:arginine exporter protein ArgO